MSQRRLMGRFICRNLPNPLQPPFPHTSWLMNHTGLQIPTLPTDPPTDGPFVTTFPPLHVDYASRSLLQKWSDHPLTV